MAPIEQVLKGDCLAQRRLFRLDPPGKLPNLQCQRIDKQARKNAFSKIMATPAIGLRFRAMDSMRQFESGDY